MGSHILITPMIQGALEIPVEKCRASSTARMIKDGHVLMLMLSIEENGLRQPINVREIDGGYEVRGGGHRLEAFRRLKRETIPAFIRVDDDVHAELAEIDENYCRSDLSPAERAWAMHRRKQLYLALHPETAAGVAGGKARQGSASDKMSFAEDTSKSTGKHKRTVERDTHRAETLGPDAIKAVTGTSLDQGDEMDALAQLSEPKRAELIGKAVAGEKVSAKPAVKKEKRIEREEELAKKQRALPVEKSGLIYCDIPRHFHVHSDETGMDRSPENHYPTMTFQQLLDLPVGEMATDDCILVYWSTAASLIDDIEIMAEWGFVTLRPRDAGKLRRGLLKDGEWVVDDLPGGQQAYRSMQVWDKIRIGLGYWFRDRHEFILIGVRGNPVPPAPGTQDHSLFSEERTEHSAKPDRVAQMLHRLWPNTPTIELFARKARPEWSNWRVWGKEAPVLIPAASNEAEEINTPTDHAVPRPEVEEIPAFLRRAPDNSVRVVSRVSTQLVDAGDGG